MRRVTRGLLIAAFAVGTIAVLGCAPTVDFKEAPSPPDLVGADKSGPPPQAPADGYRLRHPDGVVLVYDSGIGVYVVSGYTDVYYQGHWYYRLHRNSWHASRHIDGPWQRAITKQIPPGLLQEVASRNDGNLPAQNQ